MAAFRCKNCLNMSTRPRIIFNEQGLCNACTWSTTKKTLDWEKRMKELSIIIDSYKSKNPDYDCIVPVSGGKDSSYVSYTIKNILGLRPLCVNIAPPLAFDIERNNLNNFSKSGYDVISVIPNPKVMQHINKIGLLNFGIPMLGWQVSVQAYIPKLAIQLGIHIIFYGEDGEVEYGGTSSTQNQAGYTIDYSKKIYLSGSYFSVFEESFSKSELSMFTYPDDEAIRDNSLFLTHWSYFENWDSDRNAKIATKYCGLQAMPNKQAATYVSNSQNDTCLYDLHTYLMFLKFGFGRATQDAGIDIRRGAMSREQAIELVKQYDEWCPEIYFDNYLDYYKISKQELLDVFDKFANKELLHKVNGKWMMKEYIW